MPGESQGVDLIVDEFEHIVQLTPVIISSLRNRQNRFGINSVITEVNFINKQRFRF